MKTILAPIMAVLSLGASVSTAQLAVTGDGVSQLFGDDLNTSAVYGATWVYSSSSLDTGLKNAGFTNDNGWKFSYATQAGAGFIQTAIKIEEYYPWVVNAPTYTRDSTEWGGKPNGEAGGAFIRLSYTPGPSDPMNIRWLQAYGQNVNGGAFESLLDNPFNHASPFYFGSDYASGSTWFVDIPGDSEAEYEGDPVSNVLFQTFLAVDRGAQNGVQHDVLVYGGVGWGYRYSASDAVPEASSTAFGVMGMLMIVLIGYQRQRARVKIGKMT